jgi:hypothetical protein
MTENRDQGDMPAPDHTPMPYQQPMPGQYPGSGQGPYPAAAPPKSRIGGNIGLGILLVIVVVIVGGFFLFRDRLSNEVTSLQVGECFDQPAQGVTQVSEVQRQPCNDPHSAEVIAVLLHDAAPSAAYPVVSGFNDFIAEKCVPVFESYTGRTFATETELSLGYFQPTLSGWTGGDRGFTCYVSRSDEAKVTGSLRAGSQATASP